MKNAAEGPDEAATTRQLRLERDLFLRLLELGGCDDLRPFLEEALGLIARVTGAERGYLQLHGAGNPGERFWMARGFDDAELAEVRGAISTGIVQRAIATGVTISTASAVDDPRFRGQLSVQAGRIQAVLCAPVGVGISIGVLYLQGRAGPGPFAEEDRRHAELFARHLAPLAERLIARRESDLGRDHTEGLRARLPLPSIAGRSRALAEVFRQILAAAPVPVGVLLTGESGTGKTALARALHDASPRRAAPFVEVNCAALPAALFESELFGAEKGAHSTATRRLEGKIDAARSGTLFLDEVGEIPLSQQSKLLMFLQSKRYYRLGGTAAIDADVRVVAATNADLLTAVRERRFREDLYYRLHVLPIRVPPLRERPEDVAPIAEALLRALGEANGAVLPLSRAARAALVENDWPGNVRQLENALHRGWALALAEGAASIEPRHVLPDSLAGAAVEGLQASYQDALRRFQGRFLREALEAHGWNVSETARRIGLARSHLNDLLRAHGVTRDEAGPRG